MTPAPDPTVFWVHGSTWEVIGTIVQTAAIVIGGVWAYLAFVRGRLRWPRAGLKHTITHRVLDSTRVLLRTETVITNSGGVVIRLERGLFRVGQVLPLMRDLSPQVVTEGGVALPPPPDDALQVGWPDVAYRDWLWDKHDLEIEPGESDVIIFDSVVPPGLKTVEVYTWFKNVRKRRFRSLFGERPEDIGWALTTLYDFGAAQPTIATKEVEKLTGSGRGHG